MILELHDHHALWRGRMQVVDRRATWPNKMVSRLTPCKVWTARPLPSISPSNVARGDALPADRMAFARASSQFVGDRARGDEETYRQPGGRSQEQQRPTWCPRASNPNAGICAEERARECRQAEEGRVGRSIQGLQRPGPPGDTALERSRQR